MATTITVSGTRVQSPAGPTSVSSPSGSININSTQTNITGELNVQGNSTLQGSANIGVDLRVQGFSSLTNALFVASTASSISTETGAVIVKGGVGIGENLHVGGYAVVTGTFTVLNSATVTGTIAVVGNTSTMIIQANDANVGNQFGVLYTNTNIYGTTNDRQEAAVFIGGGLGVEKDLNVGGFIYGRVAQTDQSSQVLVTSTNVDNVFYPTFVDRQGVGTSTFSYTFIDNESTLTNGTLVPGGLTYNPYTGTLTTDNAKVASGFNSESTDTGALVVEGGVGVSRDVNIGGYASVSELLTGLISSKTGPIDVRPKSEQVDIFGDIRVHGKKPIGTAPVVTNVLYVTMDGNDTNDGRAMDPSRACRTVGGAINSPYYQPGTQIRVAPGRYFEDNPLRLKPYTSVMGSDIRTTEIEPINKTQDLFHVDSGCYLAFMQFCQGRSGLLPGNYYTNGTNRGAYATAFPPLPEGERIDLFHSPYIQNCTNLSGPWLKDGSLFHPNGTVQVPLAVGQSTWAANTTSIVVTLNTSISTGTIVQGMSIIQGQQNQGFFNARTLLLANKPFLQAQVVSFVEQTFNSGSFVYNTATCYRDVGLIASSIAQDMLYETISESTFAGLQYWSQANGYNSSIVGAIGTLTNSIAHAKGLAVSLVAAIDANSASIVSDDFDVVLDVLQTGITGLSGRIISNGLPSADAGIIASHAALLANRESIASQAVTFARANSVGGFVFNTSTWYVDFLNIIDSVAFDLLHPNGNGNSSNKQALKVGAYFYSYDGTTTQVPNELPQTVAAYNYIKSLIPNIVSGTPLPRQYSFSTQIIGGFTPATEYEINALNDRIDIITGIIRNGPKYAGPKIPMPTNGSTNILLRNAFELIEANISFIQDEVIAYIDSQFNTFTYNQQLCYRDVGIIVENVSYDAAFGGNANSVEAGLAYWDGAISKITGQVTQTISALDYLRSLCHLVVKNQPCPVLPPVVNIKQGTQVVNTVLLDGDVIDDSLDNLFDIITSLIRTGDPKQYVKQGSSAIDAAFVSAEVLLQANRSLIQEDTINWINNNFRSFSYNSIKCKRDISVVVDSVIGDLLFPTSERSQSTFAGLQYYNQSGLVDAVPDQINQTIGAVEYLRELSTKIVQNITPADDLVSRFQNTTPQVTNLEPATAQEAGFIASRYDLILNILKGDILGWTDKLEFGFNETRFQAVKNAVALLQANQQYLKDEVIAYINAVNPGFAPTYDQVKCARDIGYMNDSVCYDLLYSSNKQSIQAGLSYYNFVSNSSNIVNETSATIAAFTYLGTIAGSIIQDLAVTPLQNIVPQIFTNKQSTVGVANNFATAISTVTNIIANGPIAAAPLVPISLSKTTSTDVLVAAQNILANKEFIKAEVIAYINQNFQIVTPFTYDKTKCARDTGLIVDAIGMDMLYNSISDSTFAGLQYWNQGAYADEIINGISEIKASIGYLQSLAVSYATNSVSTVNILFSKILDIINNGTANITASVVFGGLPTTNANILADVAALQANLPTMKADVINYFTTNYPSLNYDPALRERDVEFMINAVCFDLLHSGNIQSIKSGVYYYNFNESSTAVPNQIPQTTIAYDFIGTIIKEIVTGDPLFKTYQTLVPQVIINSTGTFVEVSALEQKLSIITDIIANGPSVVTSKDSQKLSVAAGPEGIDTWNILQANRAFIQAEVIAYIDATYGDGKTFTYDEDLCYRDTGLIVDAVSQDIILGGNAKSREAGLAYWNKGYNYVVNQVTTTTLAINHARDLALEIIANRPVELQLQTEAKQIINPFYQYGGDYMPQEAIRRNFGIVTDIIERGPVYAPELFPGSGLTNPTGLQALDVKFAALVTSVKHLVNDDYLVAINTSTVGFVNNGTLYFGDTYIWPLQDSEVEDISLVYTGNTSTWDSRKVDPIGAMGGSLVDGGVISARSPINSFVYDAYTQLTQGGRGVHITNNGYAQLVSVFTIFSSIGVQVDNGGIASIVNSNANFGDICLLAKGYGTRKFSGTVWNPLFRAYPNSPGPNGFNQYYPNGFWPNSAQVQIFVPDLNERPHISLVMEVESPKTYINEQGFPGFLTAQPSIATLATGTITITGIDTTGVSIGNFVYVRDQFGKQFDDFPYKHDQIGNFIDANGNITTNPADYIINSNYRVPYITTGTQVTDVGYQSITLNFALPTGGGFVGNDNYFTLYFCGNAYYTVLSSTAADAPYVQDTNILSISNTSTDQVAAHIDAITYLNQMVDDVVGNTIITPRVTNTSSAQTFLPLVVGGGAAVPFIDLRFNEMNTIIGATSSTYATIVPPKLVKKRGTVPAGSGSAISLIRANVEFLADQVVSYVNDTYYIPGIFEYSVEKCRRDVALILQQLIYDLETGGNYNSVYVGISYWGRAGTHHIVQLGENVTRNDLFPDGAIVNFYQRSYISASGYVFEYVGAGTNYGALPQFGVADPVQSKETVQLDNGAVFFTSTDQNGDFRIGPGLVISQATGVLSGRTFTKSLFANMTPFILAIEGGNGF